MSLKLILESFMTVMSDKGQTSLAE